MRGTPRRAAFAKWSGGNAFPLFPRGAPLLSLLTVQMRSTVQSKTNRIHMVFQAIWDPWDVLAKPCGCCVLAPARNGFANVLVGNGFQAISGAADLSTQRAGQLGHGEQRRSACFTSDSQSVELPGAVGAPEPLWRSVGIQTFYKRFRVRADRIAPDHWFCIGFTSDSIILRSLGKAMVYQAIVGAVCGPVGDRMSS